ncbi:unnamed protein product [Parajaminaea phylloscopi]
MVQSAASAAAGSPLGPLFDKQTIAALGFVASMVATAVALAKLALPQPQSQRAGSQKPGRKSQKDIAAEEERVALAGTKVKFIFTWLVFDAICHLTLEGSFLYLSTFGRTVNNSTGFFAYLWQDYAKADARWGFSDPTVVALEILTVLGAGPLAGYCAHLLASNKFSYHYWIVVLSTAELYGGFMTFAPEWLSGNQYLNGSNWMLMWVYLFFMNMVWVVIPLYLLYDSFKAITSSTNAKAVSYLTQSPRGAGVSAPGVNGSAQITSSSAKSDTLEVSSAKPAAAVEAVDTSKAIRNASQAEENVFLFVPNLIGYTRVVLAALSLYYMQVHPKACTFLYGVSCLLDAFDGYAARRLGQSTKFGAVLDMVTDRCTTACLLCYLTKTYPRAALVFQALITLDFSSHYIHMYSTLLTGAASHKLVTEDVSRLLWYYYNDSRTLFFFCAGNELFFVCLYLMEFYPTPLGLEPRWFLLPFGSEFTLSVLKTASVDPSSWSAFFFQAVTKTTWPMVAAALTAPICFMKQVFSVVQFWTAAKVLVGVDLEQRRRARAS